MIDFSSKDFSGDVGEQKLRAIYDNLKQFSVKEIKGERAECNRIVSRYDRLKKIGRMQLAHYFYCKDTIVICNYLIDNGIFLQPRNV